MPPKKANPLCPCGSGQAYQHCCGLYIAGEKIPATPEALMRSRYSAYTQANIPYIQATMRGKAAEGYDPLEAERWAKTVKWKRLKVFTAFPDETDPTRAFVKFSAYYIEEGRPKEISETSEFKNFAGRWYYVNRLNP